MILVRRGMGHYALPVSNLQQLVATLICAKIGGRPVKFVAVYLSLCVPCSMKISQNDLAGGRLSYW